MIRKLFELLIVTGQVSILLGCAGVPSTPILSSELDLRTLDIPVMLNANLRQIAAEHRMYVDYAESSIFWIQNVQTQTTEQGWFPGWRPAATVSGLPAAEQFRQQIALSDVYMVVTKILFRTRSTGFWPFYGEASTRLSVDASAER